MDLKKMFNAIVASGFTIASAGAATTVCSGCGGEGVPVDDAGPTRDAGRSDAGFPMEGPAPFDAGPEDAGAGDAGGADASVDAGSLDAGQ